MIDFDAILEYKDIMLENYPDSARIKTSPRQYYTFGNPHRNTEVEMMFWVPNVFETSVYVDLIDHTVYVVDHYNKDEHRTLRWVNPHYAAEFAASHFDLMRDPTKDSRGAPIQETKEDVVLAASIRYDTLIKPIAEQEDESEIISVDLTDSELAVIARAAHAQDVTINRFINDVIRQELDAVMPEWRDEFKTGKVT